MERIRELVKTGKVTAAQALTWLATREFVKPSIKRWLERRVK